MGVWRLRTKHMYGAALLLMYGTNQAVGPVWPTLSPPGHSLGLALLEGFGKRRRDHLPDLASCPVLSLGRCPNGSLFPHTRHWTTALSTVPLGRGTVDLALS
jgi:hypothetical protein